MSQYVRGGLECTINGGCGSSDAMAEYNDGQYCFSCHKYNGTSFTRAPLSKKTHNAMSLHDVYRLSTSISRHLDAELYLRQAHVTLYLIEKYRIRYSPELSRVLIPIFNQGLLVGLEARSISGAPKYLSYGERTAFFTGDNFDYNVLFVVEDILSAIRIGEFAPCVALRGTNLTSSLIFAIDSCAPKHIVFWLDNDVAGKAAVSKYLPKLEWIASCSFIRTTKDPKRYNDIDLQYYINTEIAGWKAM